MEASVSVCLCFCSHLFSCWYFPICMHQIFRYTYFKKVFLDGFLAVCQSSLYLYKVKLEGCPGITQPLVLSNLCNVYQSLGSLVWPISRIWTVALVLTVYLLLVKAFQLKSVLLSFFSLILFIQNCSIQQPQTLSPRFAWPSFCCSFRYISDIFCVSLLKRSYSQSVC